MIDPEGRQTDEEILDLLVDGELDEGRRRSVLGRLDSEPDGWKRCALAFLEAQALRAELRGLALDAGSGRAVRPPGLPGRARRWAAVLSLAAALVAAFWLGRSWPLGAQDRGHGVPLAGIPTAETIPTRRAPGDLITLRLSSGSQEEEIRVPLLDVSRSDPAWQWLENLILTEGFVEALAEAGHEVFERRQFVPILLKDGRRAVLPINEVEVHPASRKVYY